MKQFLYSLGILAASVLAFTACQKEQPKQDELINKKLVTVTFTADKAGLATKTAAEEGDEKVSYIWTDEDIANIKLFIVGTTVEGEGDAQHNVETLTEVANPTVTKESNTRLVITGQVAPGTTYKFRAILCDPDSYTGSGNDYSIRKPKVKTLQSPNGTKNFDPTADILISDDKTVAVGENETTTGNMLLTFRRQVVINKMTLKNLVAGEKISKVVIKSDKHLTGYINNGTMTGQSKELSLSYPNVAVPEGGQFVVYFLTMENTEQTLTVEVTTDQNTYQKIFTKTIDFNLGQFTKFGVALPSGTPINDLSGYYLIGCLNDSNWQIMDSELGSYTYYPKYTTEVNTAIASVSESDFTEIENLEQYIWKVEDYEGAYSIKSVNTGNYVSYQGSSNAAYATNKLSSATKFTIEITSTTASIESSNVAGRKLKYNSGSPRFAFYSSGQQDIFMIPVTYHERTDVSLSFSESSPSYDTSNYTDFTGQSIIANPNIQDITDNIEWSIVDSDNITSSFNTTSGALVLNGHVGSATVTASYAGDADYKPATSSYTITVTTPLKTYIKATSIVSGKKYLIVGVKDSKTYLATPIPSSKTYAYPAGYEVTSSVVDSQTIKLTGEEDYLFTLTASGTVYTIKQPDERYIYASGSYATLNVGSTQGVWTFEKQSDDSYKITESATGDNTYIQFGQGDHTTFGRYSSDQTNASLPFLYVLDDGKSDAGISYSPASATIMFGETLTQPTLSNEYGLTVSYASDATGVANVASNGAISVVGAGSAKITASWTEQEINGVTYRAGSTSFNLTVSKVTPTIAAFNNPTTSVAVGSKVTNATTISNGLTVTYSSDNTSVATVDASTGEVTGVANGTAVISATFDGNDNFNAAEPATYTITVSGGVATEQTIFLETFGSTSSNTAISSYNGFSASAAMFTTSGNVNTHYTGSGSVGKNNLSAMNLSSGYTGASGLSGCYQVGTAGTEATILQISNINIEGATNLSVSFGALGGSTTHKVNVYYKIDNGSETLLINNGSITNANWTLLSATIAGTGNSLTLIFKHTPTKAWTIRMDDIKVVGTK